MVREYWRIDEENEMHTTRLSNGWIAEHDNFDGEVILHNNEGVYDPIPFDVLRELVAESVRADRMSKLEQAPVDELL